MSRQNQTSLGPYLTQKEVAARWKVTPTTLKNWRDRGEIPYFRVPFSSRILYPLEAILNIEKENLHGKGVRLKVSEIKREMPVVSSKSKRTWSI